MHSRTAGTLQAAAWILKILYYCPSPITQTPVWFLEIWNIMLGLLLPNDHPYSAKCLLLCNAVMSCFIKIQIGFRLSGAGLPRLSWKEFIKQASVCLAQETVARVILSVTAGRGQTAAVNARK